MYTSKYVREHGEIVTTYNKFDGVGLGYLLKGTVYKISGTWFAILAKNDVFGMSHYERDGGAGYRDKLLTGSGELEKEPEQYGLATIYD